MFKKFDKDLYDNNDGPAKRKWSAVLVAKKFEIVEHEGDRYNTDIVAIDPASKKEISFELEQRADNHFGKVMDGSYKTAHVPYRKVANGNCSHVYVGINKSQTHCYTIQMKTIVDLAKKGCVDGVDCNVDGKMVENDPLIDVPRKCLKFFRINKDNILTEITDSLV